MTLSTEVVRENVTRDQIFRDGNAEIILVDFRADGPEQSKDPYHDRASLVSETTCLALKVMSGRRYVMDLGVLQRLSRRVRRMR